MEQRKRTSVKSKKSKPRTKKPKVKLDNKKVFILLSTIAFICLLAIVATQNFLSRTDDTTHVQNQEIVVEPEIKEQNTVANKPVAPKEVKPLPPPEPISKEDKPLPKQEEKSVQTKPVEVKPIEPVLQEPFDIPPAQNNATLVIIFDDGGQNISQLKKCLALTFPVTIAVLPKLSHSVESGKLVRQTQHELMLHQPMQAINLNVNPGAGAVTPEMGLNEIAQTIKDNVAEIGPVAGFNNHEGSLITEDENKMMVVLQTANELGIYFLDSRTSSQSRVQAAAMSLGDSYYQRDIFLDNQKTRENIISEVEKGLKIANRKGYVIMIGHVWSADILPSVLQELYPFLIKKGYKFTTVSKSGALIKP